MDAPLITYRTREALMGSLAETVAGELRAALEQNERASLSVPGGTTPMPFFDKLSLASIDWSRVDIFLNDERFVPESSPRSNTRLLRESLLVNNAAVANLIPFYKAGATPEDVIPEIAAGIEAALPIDVLVLGMGEDMHTASLFPGGDLLFEGLSANAPTILPMRAPNAPEPRLTLTAPVFKAAKNKHILIVGANKRAALEQAALSNSVNDAPIRIVLTGENPASVHYAE